MKILLCSTRDLMGCLILNQLIPGLAEHQLAVLLADKTRNVDSAVVELAEIKLLERTLLNTTVFPLLDSLPPDPDARRWTFRGLAQRFGISFQVIHDDRAFAGGRRWVEAFDADLVLSARFGFIFDQAAIDAVDGRIVNFHPGALPAYAGQFPVLRAMLRDESAIGCTLHYITAGIDRGPVLDRRWLPINRQRSHFFHRLAITELGMVALIELVARLARGEIPPGEPQDHTHRHYYGWPDAREFEAARRAGIVNMTPAEYLALLREFRPALAALDQLSLPTGS